MQHAQMTESWLSQVQKKHPIAVFRDGGVIHVFTDDTRAATILSEDSPEYADIRVHLSLECDNGISFAVSSSGYSALSDWHGLG
jgi:hypothetical protein